MLKNIESSLYKRSKSLYGLIFSKMVDTSIGKMKYEDFLENTSLHDLDILFYGLYTKTHKGSTPFIITCQNEAGGTRGDGDSVEELEKELERNLEKDEKENKDKIDKLSDTDFSIDEDKLFTDEDDSNTSETSVICGHENELNVKGDEFVKDFNNETIKNVKEIIYSNKPYSEIINSSTVNTPWKFQLPESKIIIECKLPSLAQHLEICRVVSPDAFRKRAEIVYATLYAYKMYVPDMDAYRETGKPSFILVESLKEKYGILSSLSSEDVGEINKELDKHTKDNIIGFSLPDIRCKKCGGKIKGKKVDFEQLLFQKVWAELGVK